MLYANVPVLSNVALALYIIFPETETCVMMELTGGALLVLSTQVPFIDAWLVVFAKVALKFAVELADLG